MSPVDTDEIYEVEKVLAKRKRRRRVEYFIRWKGYSSKYDSWEPLSNLIGCKEIIDQFNAKELQNRRRIDTKQVSSPTVSSQQFYKHHQHPYVVPTNRCPPPKKTKATNVLIPPKKSKCSEAPIVSHAKRNNLQNSAKTFHVILNPETHKTFVAKDCGLLKNSLFQSSCSNIPKSTKPFPNTLKPISRKPPKIFLVGDQKDLINKVGVSYSQKFQPTRDHDYISNGPNKFLYRTEYRQLSETERKQISERKSVLRNAGLQTERLLYLQWRENMVEIIFANRKKGNALSPKFLDEFVNAFDAIAISHCSLAVLTTLGDSFCCGFDLELLHKVVTYSDPGKNTPKNISRLIRAFVDKLIEFPKPLFAVVQGQSYGLGCSMLAHFDTVYASDRASFRTPYVAMGQTPDGCASYMFPKLMGLTKATEMLVNGERLTAVEAREVGLVTEVFAHDSLKQNALARVQKIAAQNSEAMKLTKSFLRGAMVADLKHVNEVECNQLTSIWSSQNFGDILKDFIKQTSDQT